MIGWGVKTGIAFGLLLIAGAAFFTLQKTLEQDTSVVDEKIPAAAAPIVPPEEVKSSEPSAPTQTSPKTVRPIDVIQLPPIPIPAPLSPSPMPLPPPSTVPVDGAPREETPQPSLKPTPPPQPPPPPPLDEAALLLAVVKIQCPTADGLGEYIGSGFVLKGEVVVTAAHVVMDSGSENCKVIFPSKERRPIHYLRGVIHDLADLKRRHDEEGIDVAALKLPSLDSYPEARAIFSEYPAIPYPVCGDPQMIGDSLLHFGYPSNFVNQDYLSKLDGEVITYADIDGIKEQLSQDGTYTFKSPIFKYTNDETRLHPYMVSRVPSFYGDSGGLAFNATKQCVLGPHRGGTLGRGAGENYSVFMMLGWEKAKVLLP